MSTICSAAVAEFCHEKLYLAKPPTREWPLLSFAQRKAVEPRRRCEFEFCRGPVPCNPKRLTLLRDDVLLHQTLWNPVLGEDTLLHHLQNWDVSELHGLPDMRHEQHVRLLHCALRNALRLQFALHHYHTINPLSHSLAPASPHQQQGRPPPATARKSAARSSALPPTDLVTCHDHVAHMAR